MLHGSGSLVFASRLAERLRRFAAVSAPSLLLALAHTASAEEFPGTIPGSFSVGDQGQATYSISVETVAGAGGLQPRLSLVYNHLAGNGLAGIRWDLAGLSRISRCQQTHAQDGATDAISYGDADRYCLDGQRLVPVSGDYHASGTEYRTEVETFQRIFQSGTAGGEAEKFYIQRGNGITAYYGYTSQSRVEKVGASDVRFWYLSHEEDSAGNRLSYHFDENTSTGEVLPTSVTWTSNAGQGLSAQYSVTINYETRPAADQRSGHDGGGAKWAMTKRISDIVVEHDATEIATYTLSYTSGESERSRLSEVELCRGTESCPRASSTGKTATRKAGIRPSTPAATPAATRGPGT